MPFARPFVFFGADVFSDRQLALEMESRARKSRALNSSLLGTRYTVGTLDNVGRSRTSVEVPMSDRDQLYLLDQRAWLL
ncbi:MAG TPA: hypothetical protein VEW05_09870, partial [Candidatus Polarisedimenticolia bacterium]|nr:hypothetical protein [Candidatus Polarisedimenticolia bacterium]